MAKQRIPGPVRFWEKVDRTGTCWLWTAKVDIGGYGRFWDDSQREVGAHKFAYVDTYGPVPDGLLVCHKCDVRNCVRPDHLFLGTHKDNVHDAIKKNRFPQMNSLKRGYRTPALTADEVQTIRELYAQGRHSQQAIANMFDVSQCLISNVLLRNNRCASIYHQ